MLVEKEAKRRLLANVCTNILAAGILSLVGIWLTRYLIRNLGLELYGMVPLVLSISHWFRLFTMSITATVGRFVALCVGRKEFERANSYFNTAVFSLLFLCLLLLVPTFLLAIWLPMFFRVPLSYESHAGILFIFVIVSSFILTLSSPFMVSTFVKHRFDLSNIAKILSRISQVVILILCFKLFSVSLVYVGLSYVSMASVLLASSVFLAKYLIPECHLQIGLFNSKALCEMGSMSIWILVSQLGTLLYLNIDLVVINIFLGPDQVGYYAPITQWVLLLSVFGHAVGGVFSPIVLENISQNKLDVLFRQTQRFMKFTGIFLALPVGLLCGFSLPLLNIWLGPSFARVHTLMWLLVGPAAINIFISQTFCITRGLNKVKVPAIVTLIGGCVNLVLSILLVKYTRLGIYGVALATTCCYLGRNVIFVPAYIAIILRKPKVTFLQPIYRSFFLVVSVSLVAFLSRSIGNIYELLLRVLLISSVYCFICYMALIDNDDRRFLVSLFKSAFLHKKFIR